MVQRLPLIISEGRVRRLCPAAAWYQARMDMPLCSRCAAFKYAKASCRRALEAIGGCCVVQLCQMAKDNPDIVVLKVDFDENRDIVKPLAIKVGHTA